MEDLEWASGGTSVALLIKRNPVQITLSAQGIGELLIALPVRPPAPSRFQSMPWCQHSVLGARRLCAALLCHCTQSLAMLGAAFRGLWLVMGLIASTQDLTCESQLPQQ